MFYGYCRKSTEAQGETSFEVQAAFLIEQAKKLNEPYEILTETGSGATLADRPVFMKLLSELKPGSIVSCYDQSRISRNDKESFIILDTIIAKQARLQVNGKFINPDDPQDRAIFGMQSIFANYQKDIQKKKSIEGLKKKYANGDAIFAGDTFGYELTKKSGVVSVKIIEEEAKIIRYVFTEYSKGKALHDLERELYKTPTLRPFDFNINNLRYMIQRPLYAGFYLTISNMQRHITKYSREEIEKNLVSSNYYPPIISKDLWWHCFSNYRTCTHPHVIPHQNRWTKHECSGIYKCVDCGGGCTYNLRKRPELKDAPVYPQYIFQKHTPICPTKNYTAYQANWLEKMTKICFLITFLSGGEIGQFFEEEKTSLYEDTKEIRDAISKIDSNIEAINKKIERLIDAISEGIIDSDSAKSKMEKLKDEKIQFISKRKDLSDQISSKTTEADLLLELSAQEILDSFDDDRRKYYLRYVKKGFNYHDRLELEFINGKKFIISRPKRNNFKIFPSEVKVSFRGEEQFSFIFDYAKDNIYVSSVKAIEEAYEWTMHSYSEFLQKVKLLFTDTSVII